MNEVQVCKRAAEVKPTRLIFGNEDPAALIPSPLHLTFLFHALQKQQHFSAFRLVVYFASMQM